MVLTHDQARTFYDRFGKKQDAQAFYEDAALDDMIAHSGFEEAENVFELGCGTGRFAKRLLETHLPDPASYFGVDISRTMVDIAEKRISAYSGRANVAQSDGSMHFPVPDQSMDRVVSTYVFDLLSFRDTMNAINESGRVLIPGGKLCLVSLTHGTTLVSRIACNLWTASFRINPRLVGGCRPIQLEPYFNPEMWSIAYSNVVTQFGVPSEVVIATRRLDPDSG